VDGPYTTEYFDEHLEGSIGSARVVLPLVLELISAESAVDVGCGAGAWLSVLVELGVNDVIGVDGPYVDQTRLLIPGSQFRPHDLETDLELGRAFDLAISLEVAEHLPPERAAGFVAMLTGLAPVVLFSAAVPGQGGEHHVNEQWQDFWADLFTSRGYQLVDALRHRLWTVADVEPWYAQNALLFVAPDVLAGSAKLQSEAAVERPLSVVHPRVFENYRRNARPQSAIGRLRDRAGLLRRRLRARG
jgi:SAM-dependent methyltransferase